MSDKTKPETSSEPAAAEPQASVIEGGDVAGVSLLERLEMPVEVRFGQLTWSLNRLLDLRAGDAVPVGPDGDDAVTLYVQGRPFASGELVVVDGRFGFRVGSILAAEDA